MKEIILSFFYDTRLYNIPTLALYPDNNDDECI